MKTFNYTASFLLLLFTLCITSCSNDDTPQPVTANPDEPITDSIPDTDTPAGEIKLFAIDTARIYTVSTTGFRGATIVNRMINLNSYINAVSVSHDGTRLAYVHTQREFSGQGDVTYLLELRVAGTDGSNDTAIYTSAEPYANINALRFCADGKIFFSVETMMPDLTRKLYTINPDGSGREQVTGQTDMADVSDNRQYYLIMLPDNTTIQIIDKNGDNGAGSLYHNESFTAAQAIRGGVFTDNGKYAVIPFKEGNEVKVRIINISAKTSSTKTLVSGLGSGWLTFHLEMAANSNTGIITLNGSDYPKSKSYIFNLETGVVSNPFENSNENIFDVYIN